MFGAVAVPLSTTASSPKASNIPVPVVVDDASASAVVCRRLLDRGADQSSRPAATDSMSAAPAVRIAVDLEGRDLGPDGQIAIVTVAVSPSEVYLFDFADKATARDMLEAGQLRAVLEAPTITKIMFDVRMDVAALYHQFGCRVRGALDLQIPGVRRYFPRGEFLVGMQKVFDRLNLFDRDDTIAKGAGKKYFAPELGGDYEAWFTRPLPRELSVYCVVDVRHFFTAFDLLLGQDSSALNGCRRVTEQRIDKMVATKTAVRSAHRDF